MENGDPVTQSFLAGGAAPGNYCASKPLVFCQCTMPTATHAASCLAGPLVVTILAWVLKMDNGDGDGEWNWEQPAWRAQREGYTK